jgi:hypothetical protein
MNDKQAGAGERVSHRIGAGIEEHATQPRGAPSKSALRLVIGLDFGTAFTKVIVRAPTLAGDNSFAVPFADILGESPGYLLPTRIFALPDGTFALAETRHATKHEHLKERFILDEAPPTKETRTLVAGFFSLVLRHVRRWCLSALGQLINGRRIEWQLNVGLPAASQDRADLVALYRKAAATGWRASAAPGPVTAASLHASDAIDGTMGLPEIDVIPEVVAEVSGFARSTSRKTGLFLLVDVGAGTLDACTFTLHSDEGMDRYSIFAADVQKHGVRFVESDGAAHVRGSERTIAGVIVHTKRARNPLAPEWASGLPYFMCGGGRGMPYYADRVSAVSARLGAVGVRRLDRVRMNRPHGLVAAMDEEQFHRHAVAWGLSYESVKIGRIDVPSEIENFVRESVPPRTFGDGYEK